MQIRSKVCIDKIGKKSFNAYYGLPIRMADQDIRKSVLTSADCHDSLGFYECVTGDEGTLYADKAYDNNTFRKNLRVHGIKPRLMHRLYKGDPDRERKTSLNKVYSRVRCSVEKIFGTFKRTYQAGRARYRGFEKDSTWLKVIAIAYNLKRATSIFEQSLRFAGQVCLKSTNTFKNEYL